MSKIPLKIMAVALVLMPILVGCAPTAAPTPTVAPAATQQIELTLPGVTTGTYEIEFSRDLKAGEKVEGSIEWDEAFTTGNWRLKVRGPEGAPIKVWADLKDLTYDFDYTATLEGEYAIRIINEKDPATHHGIMKISGSWEQTEY